MRFSPSQISTYRGCPRKWAWEKVAGFKSLSTPAAALGQRVHDVLEKYLRDGTPFDFTTIEGNIAASGIEHLPQPKAPDLVCEGVFEFEGPWKHAYSGRIDFRLPGMICDHKTTKDIGKWQKHEADLLHDEQAIIYSAWYFWKNPEEVDVSNRWIYYSTQPNTRKSAVTNFRITQEHAFSELAKIEETGNEIEALVARLNEVPGPKEKKPLAIPLTQKMLEHCSAYGGCGYAGQCNIGPMERMRGFMANNQGVKRMSLLKKPGTSAAAASATPAVVPAQINPPESLLPPKVTDPAGMAAQAAQQAPAPVPSGTAPTGRGLMARVKANLGQVAAQAVVGIVGDAVAQMAPEAPAAAVPELGQHTAAEARAVAAGKKRGRPAGSKNRAVEVAAPEGTPPGTYVRQSTAEYVREDEGMPRIEVVTPAPVAKCREDRITDALEALVEEVRGLRTVLEGRS